MGRQGQIFGTYSAKIAIAILAVVVGSFLYLRFDASKNKAYSLSAQTRQALRAMEDRVVVKVFASQDLTPELNNLNRLTKDLLAEFERQSRGRFYYEYVRAKSNDDLIDQARENSIQPYMVVTMENDRQVSKAGVPQF